jgi:hypothetical protein
MWFGRPGALVELPGPTGEVDMPKSGPALHELLDGYAVDYSGRTHRSYLMTWEGLDHDDAAVIEAYATRQRGVGPFAMLLPETRRNVLMPEQATAGDAPAVELGGSIGGSEQLALSTAQSRLAGGTSWLWTLTHPLHSGFLDYDVPVAGWHGWPTPEALSWAFSAYVRPGSGDTTFDVRAVLQWLDAAGAVVSTSNGTYTAVAAGSWVRVSVAAVAPAGAVYVRPRLEVDSTDLTGGLNDPFTRSVTDGLGTAPTGQTYTTSGGAAADYDVNGTRATIALGTTSSARQFVASGPSQVRRDDFLSFLVPVTVAGGSIEVGMTSRRIDDNNFLLAEALLGTDGSVTLRLRKWISPTLTLINSINTGITHGTGKTYTVHAQAIPDAFGTVFRAKLWDASGSEPSSWMLSERVDDAALQGAGTMGARLLLNAGNSNGTVTAQFDNMIGTATAAGELYVDDALLEPGAASALTHLPGVGCRRVSIVPDSHVMPTTDYHTHALTLREVG